MTTPRQAFDALAGSQAVSDLYAGDCKGCGECCSRFLPLSVFDVERLRGYMESHAVGIREERDGVDLTCPFMTESRECSVYDARPEICRAYRCDLHKEGKVRWMAFWRSMELTDMRELIDSIGG